MYKLSDVIELFKLSKKSKIAIIGKGASLDSIDIDRLENYFIININDSEKAVVGDVGIFYQNWVLDYIRTMDGKCSFYLTSNTQSNNPKFVVCDHAYENPENSQTLQQRFFSREFHIEDATIISALKLANMFADFTRSKLDVYLLGFDFTTLRGFSSKSGGHIGFGEQEYVEGLLNSQQAYLELILSHKSDLSIVVNHVGDKSFSTLNCEQFNRLNNSIGESHKPRKVKEHLSNDVVSGNVIIVAEITTNHFGDLELLKKMIEAAAISGANYIKLQKRDVETFYTKSELERPYHSPFGSTFRDYRLGLELDEFGFKMVEKWCDEFGIKWFASVLDKPSYEFIKQFNPKLIKLPSTISEHKEYLKYIANDYKGDIVLSTGMTDASYEKFIIEEFQSCKSIYLLQCVSSYPTMNEDANVAVVRHYHDLSRTYEKIKPGYSSHDFGSICSQLAVAAGAVMVEKHVKYGNTPWAHFDNVAIDMLTDNFCDFVNDIRLAELCLGSAQKHILKSEHHKYRIKEEPGTDVL